MHITLQNKDSFLSESDQVVDFQASFSLCPQKCRCCQYYCEQMLLI